MARNLHFKITLQCIFSRGGSFKSRPILSNKIIQIHQLSFQFFSKSGSYSSELLEKFCGWQQYINPQNELHPNHHDVAILITRSVNDNKIKLRIFIKIHTQKYTQVCENCMLAIANIQNRIHFPNFFLSKYFFPVSCINFSYD